MGEAAALADAENSGMRKRNAVEVLAAEHGLTVREAEVALELADGLTYAEIAQKLAISTNTVATHVKAILGKMHVDSSRKAAVLIRSVM